MTNNALDGLQYKADIDAFVEEVARAVCSSYGLTPDDTYSIPVGVDEDGNYLAEEMPNWEKFSDDAYKAIDYMFGRPAVTYFYMRVRWQAYKRAQEALSEGIEDATSAKGEPAIEWLADNDEDPQRP